MKYDEKAVDELPAQIELLGRQCVGPILKAAEACQPKPEPELEYVMPKQYHSVIFPEFEDLANHTRNSYGSIKDCIALEPSGLFQGTTLNKSEYNSLVALMKAQTLKVRLPNAFNKMPKQGHVPAGKDWSTEDLKNIQSIGVNTLYTNGADFVRTVIDAIKAKCGV